MEVCFLKVAGIKLGRLELGEPEFRVALIAFRDEDMLTVGAAGAEACHPAVDEFNPDDLRRLSLKLARSQFTNRASVRTIDR
jgi:hypothetical protein